MRIEVKPESGGAVRACVDVPYRGRVMTAVAVGHCPWQALAQATGIALRVVRAENREPSP